MLIPLTRVGKESLSSPFRFQLFKSTSRQGLLLLLEKMDFCCITLSSKPKEFELLDLKGKNKCALLFDQISNFLSQQNHAEFLENPVELLQNPAELLQSPVELLENPAELLQISAELFQNPVKLLENPAELIQNPVELLEISSKLEANPVELFKFFKFDSLCLINIPTRKRHLNILVNYGNKARALRWAAA